MNTGSTSVSSSDPIRPVQRAFTQKEKRGIGPEREKERKEEEGQEVSVKNKEYNPTQTEIDAHYLTHWPYRSWCTHCVRGKARNNPHPENKCKDGIPIVSVDYMYMTEGKRSADE